MQERDELALHDPDQPAGGLSAGGELGETAHAHDLGPTDGSLGLAASRPDDDLADDEPDDEQQHRGLDVVAAVDGERVVRTREEEVERGERHQGRDNAADSSTEHRGDHDDQDQDERDVRGADVAA